VFAEGVTADNVERFLDTEPRVDIVIVECDSIEIKFLVREHARARRIPVVMETSDRGMIDIERFDLEPNRPLFHGRCGDASSATVDKLGRPEQIAVVMEIVDPDMISARAAGSLLEIDTTVSTWPQLASEVALGGATIATAVRRLALGRPLSSGRAYVDIEQTLASMSDPSSNTGVGPTARPLVTARRAVADMASDTRYPDSVRFVVEHATLAPSGGNCQPWRFTLEGNTLALRLDQARSRTLLDTSSHASYLALGAAIENATIAGAHLGVQLVIESFPAAEDPTLAALLGLRNSVASRSDFARLLPAVRTRATNRCLGDVAAPTAAEAAALSAAAAAHGSHLELLSERAALAEAAEVIGEADRIRFLCPGLHADAFAELRWSAEEARETRDGIDVATLELRAQDKTALRLLARADTAAVLRSSGAGGALTTIAKRAIDGAGAVGLLRVDGTSPAAWVRAGQAMQRVWLVATELGLALQPMTALLYMLELLELPQSAAFTPDEQQRLRALGTRLEQLFTVAADSPPALLFRLVKGAPLPSRRTLRRPLSAVLSAR
jgi:nitroreductase